MIRLEVEKYCENCEEFKPYALVTGERYLGCAPVFNTTVICEHADKCRALMNHLKECNAK